MEMVCDLLYFWKAPMNERIRVLAVQAGLEYNFDPMTWLKYEKFAELIINECIEQGREVQSQIISNGSEEYIAGRNMGVEVFINELKRLKK